ncbi:hypothetical protein PtrM4_027170 [Pyrenophora tritici-repentis]|uniref:Uncharacterized protein n=1 Tax=Pyrenophora tritici-repentis TaxID=45151 RepID=A0A834SHM3_9PLEO|nr:hypothetical protein PtrM4_027170 [Pyrenophora tritici-repentis]
MKRLERPAETDALTKFAKENREATTHKEKYKLLSIRKGNTADISFKGLQIPAAKSITMSKHDFDLDLHDTAEVTTETAMRTIDVHQSKLERKLIKGKDSSWH